MPKIILCADDFAFNEAISLGIIDLLKAKRLSAVSCMSTTKHWFEHAKLLLPFNENTDIGLHFNLTDNPSFAQRLVKQDQLSIKKIIIRAHAKQLSQQMIQDEFERQLDSFMSVMGKTPDFIDGHEHVHHLPTIRDAILSVYAKRLASSPTYIRVAANNLLTTAPSWQTFLKEKIIAVTGALQLRQLLQSKNIPHNKSFAGIYNFKDANNYPDIFPHFLKNIADGGLIMCHPGFLSMDSCDPIAASRFFELQYLASEDFANVCRQYHIEISRYSS